MQRIRAWWAAWRLRQRWTPKRQLEHLRVLVQCDDQWLASDTVASALTQRYLGALADDWYSRSFAHPERLRDTLGMNPHRHGDSTRMIRVLQQDGNNYCRILNLLGMEEEGDPVAEVERLMALERRGTP